MIVNNDLDVVFLNGVISAPSRGQAGSKQHLNWMSGQVVSCTEEGVKMGQGLR